MTILLRIWRLVFAVEIRWDSEEPEQPKGDVFTHTELAPEPMGFALPPLSPIPILVPG